MKKKKVINVIIKILILLVIAFIVINILPFLYFVGLVLYSMFIDIPSKPKIKHGEFPFELIYEYKGERMTISDTIICDYDGYSFSLEGGNSRDWICKFENADGYYYIDIETEPNLYIEVPKAPNYYMGDKDEEKTSAEPYIVYIEDDTGINYKEKEKIDVIDIKIVEWKPSDPLENNIK